MLIGSKDGDHLLLEVMGRSVDEPENDIDAAWVTSVVEVVADPFRGRYSLDLRDKDLAGFRDDLRRLYDGFRSGQADFTPTLETPLSFSIQVTSTGRIECVGTALGHIGEENEQRLDFRFPVPNALLDLLRMADAILAAHPPPPGR